MDISRGHMAHLSLELEPELDPEVLIHSPGFFITPGLEGPVSERCNPVPGFGFHFCYIQGWPRLVHLG